MNRNINKHTYNSHMYQMCPSSEFPCPAISDSAAACGDKDHVQYINNSKQLINSLKVNQNVCAQMRNLTS